jgi:hypothetical protein
MIFTQSVVVCGGDADCVLSESCSSSADNDVHSRRGVGERVYCIALGNRSRGRLV